MNNLGFSFEKVQYDTDIDIDDMSDELKRFLELYSASQTETGRIQDLTDDSILQYLDQINAADAYVVYDESEDALAGVALVNVNEERLWVEGIAVDPEYRDAGVGTYAMRQLGKIALEAGCGRMSGLAQPNESTLAFYEKLGFYEDDTIGRPGMYGQLIPMSAELPNVNLTDSE